MYAGYGAFMLRDLPFDAIEFMAYEQVSMKLLPQPRRQGIIRTKATRHKGHGARGIQQCPVEQHFETGCLPICSIKAVAGHPPRLCF